MRRIAWILIASLAIVPMAHTQKKVPDAGPTEAIEDCIKSAAPAGKSLSAAESCIGIVSSPCLDDAKTKSTADQNACIDREQAIWDNILNETYRRCAQSSTLRSKPSCETCSALGSPPATPPAASIGTITRAPWQAR